jgi:hypothetical protein
MPKTFYRFRTINNLIGEYNELENQSIYFAHPEQLNDPIEGFRDVYWSGDLIIWKNLFKHYLLCLESLCSFLTILGEEHLIPNDYIPIFSGADDFPTPQYKELFIKISESFFSHENIISFINKISSRSTPIRRDELFFYLNTIHPIALEIIFNVYEKSNRIPPNRTKNTNAYKILDELLKTDFIGGLEKLLGEQNREEKIINALFSAQKNIHHQMDIIRLYNGLINSSTKNKNLLLVYFSDVYINQLEKRIYPDWYTACFMSDCSNSSVWGHYGDNHSGVCLMFKSEVEGEDLFLSLNGINGWGSEGATYNFTKRKFYPIDYIKGYGSIDFFRSLGRLPIPKLNSTWYFHEGQMSNCAEDMLYSEEEWRDNYWKNFYRDITVKSKDREYEKEYRLILNNMGGSFSEKENRVLKYNFESLEGLIFGINTKSEDKAKIIKIVEKKCKEHNRKDFKFFQAYYSSEKKCIDFTEMSLLKF